MIYVVDEIIFKKLLMRRHKERETLQEGNSSGMHEETFICRPKCESLQILMEYMDEIKLKITNGEYLKIVGSLHSLHNERFQLIDKNNTIVISEGKIKFDTNNIPSMINNAVHNLEILNCIEIDLAKKEETNLVRLILERLDVSLHYLHPQIYNEGHFRSYFLSILTDENYEYSYKLQYSNLPSIEKHRLRENALKYLKKIKWTKDLVCTRIFKWNVNYSYNDNPHQSWLEVGKLLLQREPCIGFLPFGCSKYHNYDLISSITFHQDFERLERRIQNDQRLVKKLFDKNIFFYKYFDQCNREKYKNEILCPHINIGNIDEVVNTYDTRYIKELIIDHLPRQCFEDKLYIYRFISKFYNTSIIKNCNELRKDEEFILSIFQLVNNSFHHPNTDFSCPIPNPNTDFLEYIHDDLLEEDFIKRIILFNRNKMTISMSPFIRKHNNSFSLKFLEFVRDTTWEPLFCLSKIRQNIQEESDNSVGGVRRRSSRLEKK